MNWRATLYGTHAAVLGVVFAAAIEAQQIRIEIESPAQGETVAVEATVTGKISDPKHPVYVLVRPLRAREWWVQRVPPPANQDGSWETLAYFGSDSEGAGEQFQIMAITTNRRLRERQRFVELPEMTTHSDVVTVRRSLTPP